MCWRRVAAMAAVVVVLAACGGSSERGDSARVTVFAASSLTEAFTAIDDAFAEEHPDIDTTFSFASSSDLARQIVEGAPADVFVSADLANMDKVAGAGMNASEPVVFATNSAVIVVAPGNPLGIIGVADLADDDLVLVICAPEVPCGSYASRVFEAAGVSVTPDSFEENVKAVVSKVVLGEADAGIVYATDVQAADDVDGVSIPADLNIIAEYPIVALADSNDRSAADSFVEFVRGPTGLKILQQFGFGAP